MERRIAVGFGKNLQYLRKLHNGMTQEALAEKMGVTRQTVSRWELDTAYPEMEKAVELCAVFGCTLDNLFREDLSFCDQAYSSFRLETVRPFYYIQYSVISREPEEDAKAVIRRKAAAYGEPVPEIIGWDFPFVSQQQQNVFHMHGYTAAWILPDGAASAVGDEELLFQPEQRYAAVTIRNPFCAPFAVIPNGYKALMAYMQMNGIAHCEKDGVISCFEKEYLRDDVWYMDVYIAAEG